MIIPFVDLKKQYNDLKSEIIPGIEKVFEDGSFIMGEQLKEFEKNVSDYLGQESLGCASGSDALLLSLLAMEIKAGDQIITTPFTFFATAGAIARLGAVPVFVDIDVKTFNIDCSKIEKAINEKTKAILVVHIFGQCVDMDSVMVLAKRYNLKVIEDACQAFGAEYKGKQAGTIGDFGCFSFFPTKNLGGAGDGGLVTCRLPADLEKIKKLQIHGSKKKYFHEFVGINSRLDSLQAVVLDIKLKYIDGWNEKRRKIARQYNQVFSGLVKTPQEVLPGKHIFHQYAILTEDRDALLDYLQKNQVAAGVYYPLALHLQGCFKYLGYSAGSFPISEKICAEVVSLPIYPEMTESQIEFVIKTFTDFFQKHS